MSGQFWGRMFPKAFWGRWFQGGTEAAALPSAFILDENATVTFSWLSGLFKSYSGKERRSSHRDDPVQRYEGSALLTGRQTRATRSRLARAAARGEAFLLGLPYEEMTLRAAASGVVVPVHSTALSDWAVVGMPVVVSHPTLGDATSTIAAVAANSITLTSAPGAAGSMGARIMPAMSVYLDPQQGFARYPTKFERWNIKARNAVAGFTSAAVAATLELADVTGSGGLDGLRLVARTAGADGNVPITQSDDALTSGGEIVEDVDAGTLHIKYSGGATTVSEYIALVNGGSSLVYIAGTAADGAAVLPGTFDEFTHNLSGGADAAPAPVGLGATVTEFRGWPVWDRGIAVASTAGDSMQSMSASGDFGGLPWSAGSATVPDWGRAVAMKQPLGGEWQWLKAFMDAVRGRWRSWWLSTYREDLVPVSVAAGTLTVTTEDDELFAFYPAQQQHIECVVDGVSTYARITGAVDNGDGTATVSIVDEDDVAISLGSVPARVSWLERVRFESDELSVQFAAQNFVFAAQARVVQQPAGVAATDFDSAEESVEESQPREGIEIVLPVVTYRIATGTRNITIDGATYTAGQVGRDEIKIASETDTDGALTVQLPVSHPAVTRYLQGGIPPRHIYVNIWRRHVDVDAEETVWRGVVTSVAVDEHVAKLRLAPRSLIAIQRRIPTMTPGILCPHILYAADTCRINRASFMVSATVVTITGRVVTLSTIGGKPDGWAEGGELVHVESGERMTVQAQAGTVVTCQLQIQELSLGDAVELYAGCSHNVITCRDKFANVVNFGGQPNLPVVNPFDPGRGFGISGGA